MEKFSSTTISSFFIIPLNPPFIKGEQRGIKGGKKDFPLLTRNSIKTSPSLIKAGAFICAYQNGSGARN
jgi:hypothetical protein